MRSGIIRTIAVGAGAGALVLGMVAPAMADDDAKTPNPYKFKIEKNAVDVDLSANFDRVSTTPVPCPDGYAWRAWTKQKAIDVVPVGDATATCATTEGVGVLTVRVSDDQASKKRNAVVKIVGTSDTGPKIVKTFVVKVQNKKGNNGKKPA